MLQFGYGEIKAHNIQYGEFFSSAYSVNELEHLSKTVLDNRFAYMRCNY